MEPTLPRRSDGFLERGANVTRLEAFVDASFAFAVTLLVISLDAMPASIAEMAKALRGMPAFAASFAQIMMFWSAHATWSRRYGLDDAGSRRLGLVLVFLVLVYVYPLKILFGSLFAWLSHGWFPEVAKIDSLQDLQLMFVVYGLAFGSLSLCLGAMYGRALRAPVVPPLDGSEVRHTRGEIVRWRYTALVAGLSMLVALLLPASTPAWLLGGPGMVYALLSLTPTVTRRWAR
jgi:hypothetical protein